MNGEFFMHFSRRTFALAALLTIQNYYLNAEPLYLCVAFSTYLVGKAAVDMCLREGEYTSFKQALKKTDPALSPTIQKVGNLMPYHTLTIRMSDPECDFKCMAQKTDDIAAFLQHYPTLKKSVKHIFVTNDHYPHPAVKKLR